MRGLPANPVNIFWHVRSDQKSGRNKTTCQKRKGSLTEYIVTVKPKQNVWRGHRTWTFSAFISTHFSDQNKLKNYNGKNVSEARAVIQLLQAEKKMGRQYANQTLKYRLKVYQNHTCFWFWREKAVWVHYVTAEYFPSCFIHEQDWNPRYTSELIVVLSSGHLPLASFSLNW